MTEMGPQTAAPSSARRRPAGHVAVAVTLVLLGFLLAIQLRAHQGLADRLKIERESDLGQILTELTARSDRLFDEIVDLRVRLQSSSGSAEQERALLQGARQRLRSLQVLLGVVPVRGPGIVITIADPQSTVGPDVFLDSVQELRDAGAEAIEINQTRVVVATAFSGDPGHITAGGMELRLPYEIRAIGSSSVLADAMRFPGGVIDILRARSGATVRVDERPTISILSVGVAPTFTYAHPRR